MVQHLTPTQPTCDCPDCGGEMWTHPSDEVGTICTHCIDLILAGVMHQHDNCGEEWCVACGNCDGKCGVA